MGWLVMAGGLGKVGEAGVVYEVIFENRTSDCIFPKRVVYATVGEAGTCSVHKRSIKPFCYRILVWKVTCGGDELYSTFVQFGLDKARDIFFA